MKKQFFGIISLIITGAAIWATARYFDFLDSLRLAGFAIIALIFLSTGLLGIYLTLEEDFKRDPNTPFLTASLTYIKQLAAFITFIVIFLEPPWLFLRFLGNTPLSDYEGVLFIGFWILWIAASIKVLTWLNEREIIGQNS